MPRPVGLVIKRFSCRSIHAQVAWWANVVRPMPRGATSVEIYDACGLSEGCELEPCGHPFAIAFGQKTEAILEAQGIKGGICAALLVKRLGHAVSPRLTSRSELGG